MTWLKLDDGFVEHKKIIDLSDRTFRLHLAAMCYSARNLTDGEISHRALKVICAIVNANRPRANLSELLTAGLWVATDEGHRIKDYLDYNPDAESVKAKRTEISEKRKAAGKKGAAEKWRRDRISQEMRQQVALRHDVHPGETASAPCHYCGETLWIDWTEASRVRFLDANGQPTPELDHVESLAMGGANVAANLVLACLYCNRSKGSGKAPGKRPSKGSGTADMAPSRPVPYTKTSAVSATDTTAPVFQFPDILKDMEAA